MNAHSLLLALLLSGSAAAQSGTFTGTVSDASTKQPLADVVVTVSSPALSGDQVVVSDAAGQYLIPQLPPGTYSLLFEREGHQHYMRSGLQLRVDRTLRVNVELVPTGADVDVIRLGPCG